MKKFFFAALALVCMASCSNEELEAPVAEVGYGYINLGVSTNTEMVVTRAEATTLTTDQMKDYTITLTKDGQAEAVWSKTYSEIGEEDWKQPAGTYTITATNISIEKAYTVQSKGVVRVSGSNTVTVVAGKNAECEITCNPINSKVSFKYTDNFITVFTGPNTVSVLQGTDGAERNVALELKSAATENANLDAAYFEAGKSLKWKLVATLGDDAKTQKTYTKDFTIEANKWKVITFDCDKTNGILNVIIKVNGEITEIVPVTENIDPFEEA